MQWWEVECFMHRWSNDHQRIGTPTQLITLTPTEMLYFVMYITEPYTSCGRKHNCLKIKWPDLLNDIITNCLTPQTNQGGSSDTKLKAHLTEGDDSTIYLHTTEDDGSPPKMFLTDIAQLIASQQQSPPRIPALTLPSLYVPPGQPPNAPIRQRRKTAVAGFLVNENKSSDDEDDNVPLARIAAYAKNKKPSPEAMIDRSRVL